ncbi:MAG: DUF2892 domain-containing protein [Chitinophagales bacterium]|nr:DUF2892 domain-containing protein [Bacteroidota bacterium]MCB9227941.1 DUF2892 domain-containing protein [Chitinophagales bacterium]
MALPKNVGKIDKFVRLGLAILISVLISFNVIQNTIVALVLLAIAIIFLATSFLNFCPLYTLFGINTCKYDKK